MWEGEMPGVMKPWGRPQGAAAADEHLAALEEQRRDLEADLRAARQEIAALAEQLGAEKKRRWDAPRVSRRTDTVVDVGDRLNEIPFLAQR